MKVEAIMELFSTAVHTRTHTLLPLGFLSIPFSETLLVSFDRGLCGLKVQLPTVMTQYSLAGL